MRRVRIIHKAADYLDGIDLSNRAVGDVIELHQLEAERLIAAGWAVREHLPRAGLDRRTGVDRRQTGDAMPASAPDLQDAQPRVPRSVERLREHRVGMERQRRAEDEHRRIEEQIRQELQDSRAKTVPPSNAGK
jgi:hypothetical protein